MGYNHTIHTLVYIKETSSLKWIIYFMDGIHRSIRTPAAAEAEAL